MTVRIPEFKPEDPVPEPFGVLFSELCLHATLETLCFEGSTGLLLKSGF